MADMITRCPKCGTAFRISDALLKSAKGVVRCGSCLSVFNARDHLESGKTTPTTPSTRPTRPAETPSPKPLVPAAPIPPPPAKNSSPPPAASLFENEQDDDDVDMPEWRRRSGPEDTYIADESVRDRQSADPDNDEDEDDEAWALELLKDDDDLNIQLKKVTPKPAVTPPPPPVYQRDEDTLSAPQPDVAEAFAEIDEQLAPMPPVYNAPAQSFSELESKPATTDGLGKEPITAPNPIVRKFEYVEPAQEQDEQDEELDSPPEPPPEPPKRKPIRPKLEPKSTPLKDVIASLEPEPLEVDWQEPGAWRRRLLWPLLALVALLCLLAQVAWLEFDRLSRVEPYRSAYGVACRIVGCKLPELIDRTQIQTSNLLVRSHPEVADALQVDVILQNNAPFEQTFPVLELTFTNLRSEPVATRRLLPQDYLGGELAGRDTMPVRQPIHIALEIADPGKEAVSYHITIVE